MMLMRGSSEVMDVTAQVNGKALDKQEALSWWYDRNKSFNR